MKSLLIVLSAFCFTGASAQTMDSLYIVTYTTGSAWDTSKKPGEQLHFKEHGTNLSSWRKAGTIKFGARYADKGMIVITASSLQAAKELINSDQAVANKLFNVDIQKLNPFYEGCIEKPKPQK